MRGSPATIAFYHYTARNFIFLAEQKDGITTPSQININEVRTFLAELGIRTKVIGHLMIMRVESVHY
jgi:hypothetical protein